MTGFEMEIEWGWCCGFFVPNKGELWQTNLGLPVMGSPHQMYIIAKVGRGAQRRYRCVGAFHWQYSSDHEDTIHKIIRFIEALRNPVNARLVQADLETFDNYETKMQMRELDPSSRVDEESKSCPCPYIDTLYYHVTCIRVDDRRLDRCHFLPPEMRPSEGDYGEGITVIDITEPVPRYCMAVLSVWKGEYNNILPPYVPLTAEEYLTERYPILLPWRASMRDSEDQQEVIRLRKILQPVTNLPLIDINTLAEAWPEDFGPDAGHKESYWWDEIKYVIQEKPWIDRLTFSDIQSLANEDKTEIETDGGGELSSLTTLATFKSVEALSQSDVAVNHLEYLLQIPMAPGPIVAVRNLLFAQSKLPDSVLPFLSKNILHEQDGFIDISSLALSDGQLIALMKDLPECRILKLGERVNVKPEEIVEVIHMLPKLHLVMIFHRNISIAQVEEIRHNVPDNRVMIAHKWEYFQHLSWFYSRYLYKDEHFFKAHYQYHSSNTPEFLFLCRHPKYKSNEFELGGVGIEVIEDLDHIIQAIRDIVLLSPKLHMPAAIACFTAVKRGYEESFSSTFIARLISCAPRLERELEGKVQWIFLYGQPDILDRRHVKFGFIRHQCGSPLQVMDVDDFIQAISKERPDLPITLGTDPRIPRHENPEFSSFLPELCYFLGEKYDRKGNYGRNRSDNRPLSELWTVEEVKETFISL